jgi:glycosyltransferase involved in cell wall biosynthesis
MSGPQSDMNVDTHKIVLLIDAHTFDMEPQGTSTFLAGVLNAMPEVLPEVCPGVQLELHLAGQDRAKAHQFVHVPHTYHEIASGFVRRNILSLPLLSRKINADFVLSQYVRPLWVKGRSLTVIHDMLFVDFPAQFGWVYRYSRYMLFGISACFSAKVYTVSHYSRQRIAAIYGLNAEAMVVVPNAVRVPTRAVSAFRGKREAGTLVSIIYVARLELRKRHEWCLQLLGDLLAQGHDVKLTIVGGGGGPYADQLRRQFNQDAAVRFQGRLVHREGVSDLDLDQLLAEADLLVYPSLGEGFGIPVIEAAARGLPCVVADGTALGELRPYFAGEQFDKDDYGSFLGASLQVIQRIDTYAEEAAGKMTLVGRHFAWSHSTAMPLQE